MGHRLFFRYLLFRYYPREVIAAALLAASFVAALYFLHNPAVSVVNVEATVVGITTLVNKMGGSNEHTYSLRLDDGTTVIGRDFASRPHVTGSRVTIERITYRNGRVWYRFPNFISYIG